MGKKYRIFVLFILSLSAVLAVLLSVIIGGAESEDIIYIRTPRELQEFARDVNSGNSYRDRHVVLANDLDMSGIENFTPIGEWGQENYFYGVFDGNGHVISNLTIIGEEENLGLFGSLGGIICNLTIENCYIKGAACGAFCSIAEGDGAAILNCAVRNAQIDASYTDVIGGQYLGIRENCVIDGEGDIEELNNNLRRIWRMQEMVPVNLWTEGENGAVLSQEKGDFPYNISLRLAEGYDGELQPLYIENEDSDVFCIPCLGEETEAEIVAEFPDGTVLRENVILPQTKTLEFKKNGETYPVRFQGSENTATVFLDTQKAGGFAYLQENKSHMLPGTIQVLNAEGKLQYVGGLERIRGRGNDSWLQEKQSFGFKLTDYGNILGMGSDKDYVLIPGYRNASWLTYQVVWDLCRELQWEHALEYRMVQLYVDGQYRGIYFLTEKIEAGEERIPIVQSRKETGGYVFQYDNVDYTEEDDRIVTDVGNSYTVVSPTLPTEKQMEYCLDLWNAFEEALYSDDGYNKEGKHYTEYADLESLAAQWLFYELNGEISIWSSIYFYKDGEGTADEKIHALFPWDVEHSYVHLDYADRRKMMSTRADYTNGFWVEMASHEDFVEELRRQWQERYLPALEKLMAEEIITNEDGVGSLNYYVEQMRVASDLNELLWGAEQDVALKAEEIRAWMNVRIPFLSENLYLDEFFIE